MTPRLSRGYGRRSFVEHQEARLLIIFADLAFRLVPVESRKSYLLSQASAMMVVDEVSREQAKLRSRGHLACFGRYSFAQVVALVAVSQAQMDFQWP